MKKLIEGIKKYFGLLKLLFFLSVVVIVVRELLVLNKSLSYEKLLEIFSQIALWKILLMLLVGILSVTPMIGYDWILNRNLDRKWPKKYLLETSWMINTINNIAGFGGLISIGLRSQIYGKNKEVKAVTAALSKIFLFMMSGLSIYSAFALLRIGTQPHTSGLANDWLWLLGGSLYFPMVLLANAFFNKKTVHSDKWKEQLSLIMISFFEWTGVLATFFVVGRLMGIDYSFSTVFPIFITASVIGAVSMIPGALGSFDLVMLIGLTRLGLSKELVTSWLLLYRLFYYVVPFLFSLPVFAHTTGKMLNERYEGVPKRLLSQVLQKITVIGYYVFGILLMLSNVFPRWFDQYIWLQQFHLSSAHLFSQIPNLIIGAFFLIIGRGLSAKVSRSLIPAFILLIGTSIYCLSADYGMLIQVYLVGLLLLTYVTRRGLFRQQFVYAWEWLTIDGLILVLFSISYIVLGVENRHQLPKAFHFRALHFINLSIGVVWLYSFLILLSITLCSVLLIRYLQGKKESLGQDFDEEIVQRILTNYGGNLTSQLVFLKDKQIFVYEKDGEQTVFFQFGIHNNKCVVMGDPSGKKEDFREAVLSIIDAADVLGYTPVFYEVSEPFVFLLHEYGYDFFKMGEEAHVYLPDFTLSGKKMKGNRALINKLIKSGYTFEVLKPPFSQEIMTEIKVISDAWLGSRKEKGFSLGFFSEDYLQRAEMAIVRDQEGAIVAFSNIMPTYDKDVITIDLMRHHPQNAPSGSMDFLFIHLFEWSQAQGYDYFSLGMAPLANVGVNQKSFIQERIAHLVYQFGSRFYSFQGLRKYKAKYATKWAPSYLLYHRDTWILYVMIALLMVDDAPKREN
ncbi:bifunctional lysylphosphatidylglycerol flippase/synthetase MprF [Enterococcus alcedinis]|uniref:Phosphatidylglycerol lysyltransferase n=1 Tax=Enterococcus alcedinis TaxID=1274384 RepID=A0A917N5R8_9ENTE|nr:bifunctional lysylphosphatidylglycerol flippase/synthetase MprF [Enterococcus alcedinis]MBP2101619.1 phosphatidylglycerol lysyltransferase [Enterococcus alcedinis]GGI64987.1 phosphatidylglycerol lysyltransferase [Enterococcus alcedinis]